MRLDLMTISLATLFFAAALHPAPDATLSGHVYIDRNGNGQFDAGERGLRGVAVSNQDQVVVSDEIAARLGRR